MAKYRILSLDGGGLRGLITARMLQRLNDRTGIEGFLEQVDLIVGTSTGGILALGLAAGKTPEDICQLYLRKGAAIFGDSLFDNVRDLGNLIGAQYSNEPLRSALGAIFGQKTLGDLVKKVAIPCFDLDNEAQPPKRHWKPKIFHNFGGAGSDAAASAVDVALYTSAAPTYFPSVDGYIDGGVFANNPSLVGIAQAISYDNLKKERAKLKDIMLLSVGTGMVPAYISGTSHDWGKAQWLSPLIGILLEGVSGIADYQSRQLLGARYHRLQPDLVEPMAMDAVDRMDEMNQLGINQNLDETAHWVRTHWQA